MNSHANLAHPLEWLSGRSGPAGNALLASWEYTNDLSGILWLFLLEGSHTTLRGSSPGRFRTRLNSAVLGARPVLNPAQKAHSAANTSRAPFYNVNISMRCGIGAASCRRVHPDAGRA